MLEGQYANVGSVIGDRPDGSQSGDDDPSHYFGGSDDDQVPDELQITKVADTSWATPDGVVTYTVTVTNTGSLDYTAAEPAEVVDDLIDVLDDAAWMVGNATISAGRVSFSSPELTWTGALAVGDEVTITYAVRVNPTLTGSGALHNTIVADASNCGPGAAAGATSDPACETTTQIVPPAPPDPITARPIPITG